jgi:magnesium transporter
MPAMPTLGQLRGRNAPRLRKTRESASGPRAPFVVDCGVYVGGERLPGEYDYAEAISEVRARGEGFAWIGLHEPSEQQIQGIADTFDLHALAVEDAVHAHQRPKLEPYGDILFMVLKTVRYVEHSSPRTANEIVETGEIMAFLGEDFIITVRHGKHTALAAIRRELESDPEQLALGPAAVLYAIADHVVDNYLAVTGAIESDIDEVETEVFVPRSAVSSETIYLMKREVLQLRRAVAPLASPLRRLAEGAGRLVPVEVRSYFRNVEDHLATVTERVAGFDEMLTTLVDATLAKISLQQNTDMRKITAWAAILAIPTMVAGIYGMNFHYMPETDWRFGYPVTLAVILAICVTLYCVFRRKEWL